jgi:hypothetical protein
LKVGDEHSRTASDGLRAADIAASIDCIRGGAATIASVAENLDALAGSAGRRVRELLVDRLREHADEIHTLARIISDHLRRTEP